MAAAQGGPRRPQAHPPRGSGERSAAVSGPRPREACELPGRIKTGHTPRISRQSSFRVSRATSEAGGQGSRCHGEHECGPGPLTAGAVVRACVTEMRISPESRKQGSRARERRDIPGPWRPGSRRMVQVVAFCTRAQAAGPPRGGLPVLRPQSQSRGPSLAGWVS